MGLTYNWVWALGEWEWSTTTGAGLGGAPTSSDIAYIAFAPTYPMTFSQDVTADWLSVTSDTGLIGNGTLTGDITANTIIATDIVFTGSVTTGWFTDAPGSGTGTVAFAGGDLSASGPVLIGGATLAPVLFDVSGGAVIHANASGTSASLEVGAYGDMEINQGTVVGTLISVTAGTINVGSGGTLAPHYLEVDGTSLDGPGTVAVNAGGVMNTETAALGTSGLGSDIGTIDVNGGTWTNTASLAVGLGLVGAATGVIAVSGSGSLTAAGGAHALDVGVLNSSSGTVGISGSGSTLDVTGSGTATIGDGGTGVLAISGGGAANVGGDLVAGATAGASGSITVDGSGTSLDVSLGGTAVIGNAGTGALGVTGGAAATTDGGLVIGAQSTGSGAVTVTGAGSDLQDGGVFVIGQSGTGKVTVSGGTLDLFSGGITIGALAGAVGSMTMDASSLTVNGGVLVGEGGTGSLKLVNNGSGGAAMTAAALVIGDAQNASGKVTVDGAGSTFDSSGVTVGNAGSGGMKVTGTAVVTTNGDVRSAIALSPAQDTMSVDTGGQWLISGALAIGQAGTAAMKVAGGASVTAAEIDLGLGTLASGTLSISSGTNPDGTPQDATVHFGTLLEVGVLGTGTIKLGGNATLATAGAIAGSILIGVSAGSTGTISLSGTNDLLSGGALSVGSGSGTTASTGLLGIGAGESVSVASVYVAATGIVKISGGDLIAPSIGDDGTISGSGTILGAFGPGAGVVVATAGSLELSGTVGSLMPQFDIGSKGTLQLDSTVAAGATLVFDGTSSVLRLPDFADYQNAPMVNFGTGDKIILPNVIANKGEVSGNELILEDQVVQGGTTVVTVVGSIDFPQMSSLSAVGFKVRSGPTIGVGTTITLACFVAGTRLAIAQGSAPVERLHAGDRVRTAGGALRAVRWIGVRRIDLTRHPDPRRAQPIRILVDAFADGVPSRDLLLSPDHAVFDRGRLVPIRLLVNDATIRRESRRRKVTYFHVELDSHDLLLAEGLPAESYLDTGNRGVFANADEPLVLHPDFRDPAAENRRRLAASCAPLTDAPAEVEKLWWRLADRAHALGFALPAPALTEDPALAVRAGGRRLRPLAQDGARYRFALPAGPAWLLSRAAYPSDARPWMEDQRRLGVMIRSLTLGEGDAARPIALDDPALDRGWWAPETDGVSHWRWSDGSGALPVLDAPAVLEVELAGTLSYPLTPAAVARAPGRLKVL